MNKSFQSLSHIKNWKIFSGLCVRRPAVISPLLSPLEQRISGLFESLEFERSHLSAHELRHKIEQAQLSKASKQDKTTASATSESSLLTTVEKELIWESEAEKFVPAERLTGKLFFTSLDKWSYRVSNLIVN